MLARRPRQLSAAKKMEMEMGNLLPAFATVVEHNAVNVGQTQLFGHFANLDPHLTEQRSVFFRNVVDGFDRIFRYE